MCIWWNTVNKQVQTSDRLLNRFLNEMIQFLTFSPKTVVKYTTSLFLSMLKYLDYFLKIIWTLIALQNISPFPTLIFSTCPPLRNKILFLLPIQISLLKHVRFKIKYHFSFPEFINNFKSQCTCSMAFF